MSNVFSAEMYKLKCNKQFYVCLVCLVVFNLVSTYYTHSVETAADTFKDLVGFLPLFLALSVSNIACNDYERGTMKNLLSSGNSKIHLYCGKLYTALVAGLIYFVVDSAATLIMGYVLKGTGHFESIPAMCESLLLQVALLLLYTSIFFGFSMMCKGTKAAFILNTVFYFAFSAFVTLFATRVLKSKAVSTYTLDTLEKNIEALKLSIHMVINFGVYITLAVGLNIIGYVRFKTTEA